MHPFQLKALKKLCEKHGLDPQLIDDTLTYEENKKYLLSLVMKDPEDRDKDEIDSYTEWYMKEHFLSYYISRKKEKQKN